MTAQAITEDDLAAIRVPLIEIIERHARERPDHVAIQSVDDGRSVRYGELRDICHRFAAWLTERGIGANDRVVLMGGNSVDYVLIYFSVLRHGATLCLLNAESLGGHLPAVLAAVRPRIVLHDGCVDPADYAADSEAEWLRYVDPRGEAPSPRAFFAQVADQAVTPPTPPVGGPDDLAMISYTSGTTGRPKGIVHHYSAMMANIIATARALEMSENDRILEYRSFAWLSARARLLTALYTGATLVIAQRFSQSRFFDWIRDQKLTIAFGVPTVISMLISRPVDIRHEDVPHLRYVTSSTAPLPVEHQRAFEERYGVDVLQFYGASESGGLTVNPPGRRRLGSVGCPCLYQDVRIVGPDGETLPPNAIGEIETGGEQMSFGYLEYDGSITGLRGTRLKTGDLGYFDDDGFLFITGRSSELINRGGVKISPLEIDNALLAQGGLAEVATVGVPDEIYGEEIASFVVPRNGEDVAVAALLAGCARVLPENKVPRQIIVLNAIPKTARAKVDRSRLVEFWRAQKAAE